MASGKLTPKQEAFALAYIETGNASEAYRRAYSAENMTAQTIHKRASELLDNGEVAGRVKELQAALVEKTELTVASITDRLLKLSQKAENLDGSAAFNVARQCLMDAAKLNGLVVETSETIQRSPEERAARLAMLKAERERLLTRH